jgi:hypothetical protein
MQEDFFSQGFPIKGILAGSVLPVLGAVALHLWTRFRKRLSVLRWSVQYHVVGISAQDDRLGRIQILHNDKPVSNVRYCALQIENESQEDLTDLEICLDYNDGSKFLSGEGQLAGSPRVLYLTPEYVDALKPLKDVPPDKWETHPSYALLTTSRYYSVPVLNRGGKIDFQFLIQPTGPSNPILDVKCEHKGVSVKERPGRSLIFGVDQKNAILLGLLISLVLLFISSYYISTLPVLSTICFMLGIASSLLGVLALKMWRVTLKYMS